jgi:hypothetical protein
MGLSPEHNIVVGLSWGSVSGRTSSSVLELNFGALGHFSVFIVYCVGRLGSCDMICIILEEILKIEVFYATVDVVVYKCDGSERGKTFWIIKLKLLEISV